MKRFHLLPAIALLVAVSAPTAQQPPSARVDPARLSRLDGVLQKYVDEHQIVGAVALILQDGKSVYENAVGWRDAPGGVRMTPDSLFRIASQTKAITSTAILMLVEEGKIGLTDPVSRFLPEYAKTTVAVRGTEGSVEIVPARRAITITDLLTHTAGISYGTGPAVAAEYEAKGLGPVAGLGGWYTADKDEPVCETMERLGTLPFAAQPGEAWVYGYSTDILGCVVERASGEPLDRFLQSRIFGPLGMTDTHFFLPAGKEARLVTVYASGADGKAVRAPDGARGQGHYVSGPRKNFAGGAGLVSTARDYARFLEMVRRGGVLGDVRLLSPRTVALMTHNQVGTLHNGPHVGYSLAFETTERVGGYGLDPVGSYGWGGAYGSVYRVDPGGRIVMVLMLNQMPNRTDIRTKFQTLVHQSVVQ